MVVTSGMGETKNDNRSVAVAVELGFAVRTDKPDGPA